MTDIKVWDDFVDKGLLLELQRLLTVPESGFPWYWHKLCLQEPLCDSVDNYFLAHVLYNINPNVPGLGMPLSEYMRFIDPILKKIDIKSLIRVKANLYPRTAEIHRQGFHIDFDYEHSKTAVFFVNSNDGFFEFEDGTKIESVENRFVEFPSRTKHSGTSCTDQPSRVTLNFNYF